MEPPIFLYRVKYEHGNFIYAMMYLRLYETVCTGAVK